MSQLYTEKDLTQLLERYIKLREHNGLAREQAVIGAMAETKDQVAQKLMLVEAGVLKPDEQSIATREMRKVTDRLDPARLQK